MHLEELEQRQVPSTLYLSPVAGANHYSTFQQAYLAANPGDVLQVGASKLRLVVPDVSEMPTMGNVQNLVRGLGAEGLLPL